MVFEMMQKCDKTLTWDKFNSLPINVLAQLATVINTTVGSADGGGVLGNS